MLYREEFLFSEHFLWEGKCYLVHIYRREQQRPQSSHMAATVLGPGDTIISDGRSPEDVLQKQQDILPLALLSRSLLAEEPYATYECHGEREAYTAFAARG